MSFQVDEFRVNQFRADRALLPYDDIEIARRMGIDNSTYSKSVKQGPITNRFLGKFYGTFGDELIIIKEKRKAASPNSGESQAGDFLRRFDELLTLVDHLIAGQKELRAQVESLEKETDKDLERIPKIESLITQLAMCMAPGII